MTELLSSCRNYDNYRRAYGECTHFKIPILGVHLKDLISLYEAMPDYLEDGKVNVHKLLALYNHINELVQLQEVAPPLEANKDLVHLLTVSLIQEIITKHCVPGANLCTLPSISSVNLHKNSMKQILYLHFVDGDTEAQRHNLQEDHTLLSSWAWIQTQTVDSSSS